MLGSQGGLQDWGNSPVSERRMISSCIPGSGLPADHRSAFTAPSPGALAFRQRKQEQQRVTTHTQTLDLTACSRLGPGSARLESGTGSAYSGPRYRKCVISHRCWKCFKTVLSFVLLFLFYQNLEFFYSFYIMCFTALLFDV